MNERRVVTRKVVVLLDGGQRGGTHSVIVTVSD